MRTSAILCLVLLTGCCSSSNHAESADSALYPTTQPGDPVDGLKLTLDRASKGSFDVTLLNVGTDSIFLNLGFMLNCGRLMFPAQIHLIVTTRDGKLHKLVMKGPPGVGGSFNDLLVPLTPAGKFTITLALDDFVDEGNLKGNWKPEVAPGDFVRAVYDGPAPSEAIDDFTRNLPLWTHTVESAARRFEK